MEGQELYLLAFVLSARDLSVVAAALRPTKFPALDLLATDHTDRSGQSQSFRDALRKLAGRGVGAAAALDLIAGVLEGLRFAHVAGVIHRDVKPENLFIHRTDAGSVPKILDFGIAHLARGGRRVTGQHFLGTPRYASPEQIRGDSLTEQSDLYSVGLVLYELVTGEQPYARVAPRDMGALCAAHLLEPLPDPSSRVAGLPPTIPPIVKWLVEKAPAERCPNAFAALALVREARSRIDDNVTGAIHRDDFQTQPTPMENLLLTESRTEDPSVIEVSERTPMVGSVNDTTPDGPPIFDPAAQVRPAALQRTAKMQAPAAAIDRSAPTRLRVVAPGVRPPPRSDTEPMATPLALAETTPPSLPPTRTVSPRVEPSNSTTSRGLSTKIGTSLERRPAVRGLVYLAAACAVALAALPLVLRMSHRSSTAPVTAGAPLPSMTASTVVPPPSAPPSAVEAAADPVPAATAPTLDAATATPLPSALASVRRAPAPRTSAASSATRPAPSSLSEKGLIPFE